MHILIYQSLWSEIIIDNPMPLSQQRKLYELTDDNFIRNVRAFVRNKEGEILMIRDIRYNRRAVPGGKVDKWETFEQALEKEIVEELWITIVSKKYIWWRKAYMRGSKWCNARMAHYYDISISGIPTNNEFDKGEEISCIKLNKDKNNHLISIEAKGEIISDTNRIYDEFPWLHTLIDVLPYMPQTVEEVEVAPFDLPDHIDLEKTYQQRYDTKKNEYFIKEIK